MIEFDSNFTVKSTAVQRTLFHYDLETLLSDFKRIEPLIGEHNQVCVNSESGAKDPLYHNVGVVRGLREPVCDIVNEPFQGTIFEKILKDLGCLTSRARIMRLKGRATYSFHWDTTPRYHVPLLTNKNAFIFFEGEMPVHLPADGSVYWLDTRKPHTALNCDMQPRYHFVFVEPHSKALPCGGYR